MRFFLPLQSLLLLYLSCHAYSEEDDEPIPSTMCPRFSVHEFYSSLFQPLFNQRLDFLETFLKTATDAVEVMLKTVEEKKGNDGAIAKHGNFAQVAPNCKQTAIIFF